MNHDIEFRSDKASNAYRGPDQSDRLTNLADDVLRAIDGDTT